MLDSLVSPERVSRPGDGRADVAREAGRDEVFGLDVPQQGLADGALLAALDAEVNTAAAAAAFRRLVLQTDVSGDHLV